MRDELWWNAHHWFQDKRGAISTKLDRELVDQLTGELTSIRYGFRGSKIKVESKDELKKRGLPSPNLGDALCLTFAKVPLELKSSSGRRVVEATDYTW